MTTRAWNKKNKEKKKREKSQKCRERQCRAELKEYEKEEVNNESHKGKILRMNESQINCVTRGSHEGQWGNPGGRTSVVNKINQTRSHVEVRLHTHVMMKCVLC